MRSHIALPYLVLFKKEKVMQGAAFRKNKIFLFWKLYDDREYSRIPNKLCYWIAFLTKKLPLRSQGILIELFIDDTVTLRASKKAPCYSHC